jgi:hypothetical protein
MKRTLNLATFLCFATALIVAVITHQDVEEDGELIKSFRDPDRVDKRWLYVTGLGTAAACFALWSMYEKKK